MVAVLSDHYDESLYYDLDLFLGDLRTCMGFLEALSMLGRFEDKDSERLYEGSHIRWQKCLNINDEIVMKYFDTDAEDNEVLFYIPKTESFFSILGEIDTLGYTSFTTCTQN